MVWVQQVYLKWRFQDETVELGLNYKLESIKFEFNKNQPTGVNIILLEKCCH